MSCRLPSSSGESKLIPVMLPPGRASEVTTFRHHVIAHADERYSESGGLQRAQGEFGSGDDHIRRSFDYGCRQFGKMLITGLEPIAIYREILPFDKAVEP